jgi:hypothetical protein
MGYQIAQRSPKGLWVLAKRQHGVVARSQLLELGFAGQAIKHRVVSGRLHPVGRGVYAVGRPELTQHGHWSAAILSCGPEAALSHGSAAALWGILPVRRDRIVVTVPGDLARRRPGIEAHRRSSFSAGDVTRRYGIRTTTPICTLIDCATYLERDQLEAAINEADKLDLTDPEELRSAIEGLGRRPGLKALRDVLDRRTFTLTDSELERRFLPIARRAGLPPPETGTYVNGFKVDFYWPALGLVVETDGLRYHRTPAQQARDRLRDQTHKKGPNVCEQTFGCGPGSK